MTVNFTPYTALEAQEDNQDNYSDYVQLIDRGLREGRRTFNIMKSAWATDIQTLYQDPPNNWTVTIVDQSNYVVLVFSEI